MWIFMSDSLLSIVAHKSNPNILLVRARAEGDIEAVFPDAQVFHTPSNDYAYRAFLPRQVVAVVMATQISNIDYTNFKNSVQDNERHGFYFAAYNAVFNLGRRIKRRQSGHTEPIPF